MRPSCIGHDVGVWLGGSRYVICMLYINKLKSLSESMEPCGTPFVQCNVLKDLQLYTVHLYLPGRKLESIFLKLGWVSVMSILLKNKCR